MGTYVLRRLIYSVFTLLVLSIITFGVAHGTPGGPFGMDDRELGSRMTDEMKEHYRRVFGLDQPVYVQYLKWLWAFVQGDLGMSFYRRNETINEIIGRTWAITAELGLWAAAISITLGTVTGVLSAMHKDSLFDVLTTAITVFGVTVPQIVLGVFLLVIFSVELKWLPVTGWGSWDRKIMPIFVLSLGPFSTVLRFARGSVLEVMNQDYVRTARAKGLRHRVILYKHVLKNALIPIVTISGPLVMGLMTGSVFVETMFVVPGIAASFFAGAGNRDYPMIMAVTMVSGILVVIMNLTVDITYGFIDPRIRYD